MKPIDKEEMATIRTAHDYTKGDHGDCITCRLLFTTDVRTAAAACRMQFVAKELEKSEHAEFGAAQLASYLDSNAELLVTNAGHYGTPEMTGPHLDCDFCTSNRT